MRVRVEWVSCPTCSRVMQKYFLMKQKYLWNFFYRPGLFLTILNFHFQVHKSEKQFTCNICSSQFRHKNSLVRHLFQHSGERPFRCQSCESCFTSIHRMREHIKKRHPTSQAAQSIGLETNYLNITPTRSYPPIAPAPAPAKLAPTTLVLQQQQPQHMTPIMLPNGMIYLVNQTNHHQTFQQPLLVSMPTQQPIFLGNPGLSALGSQFLSTGNGNGTYIFAQTMTSQQPIFINAPQAQPAQMPLLDNPSNRMTFMDGSYRLESDDRLTYKSQNGETVKLDILERAILEIPNLTNEWKTMPKNYLCTMPWCKTIPANNAKKWWKCFDVQCKNGL